MERYGVIMAGGGGTRFWPLSRAKTPKQLLNLTGRDLMINETLDRLGLCVPGKNLYVVTSVHQARAMRQAVGSRVMPGQILAEPSARNTAACIGYAALEILKKRGDGILCVAPSDAYIRDWPEFARVMDRAIQAAEEGEKLVTIGIAPTFPATGYGYLRFEGEGDTACPVREFKEKPDAETARRYLESGNYAWNSGMFIWKASAKASASTLMASWRALPMLDMAPPRAFVMPEASWVIICCRAEEIWSSRASPMALP